MGLLGKKKQPEAAAETIAPSRDELVRMLDAAKSTVQESEPQPKQSPEKSLLGGNKMVDLTGITLDMGEGMSLNIPIEKNMSLHDFLMIAEKVKKLEMMQFDDDDDDDEPKEEHHH